ncbi:NB-ARC domain-containing protein [Argonema antarcticum]|uniref:NB-ARC domain-containing protein n=1 Tax=Argonema antarcticum TaxID=2942763 RepID=UPI00201213CC|nr:NB-ARC domain-containing protein [Argonema antarcticum]MCL1475312.1 ATP-binding protein [Argonema antarcticum A004/B2]
MDVQEVLKLADDIVFAKTGKHLDNLQEGILRGTWQRQKYPEIAKTCYRSEAHVKKVASKLWKLLSETLGEDINQSNFRYTVERLQLSIVESNFGNYYAQIDNFSVCENNSHPSEIPNTEKPNQPIYNQTKPKIHLDLSDAPEPNLFYNRTSELTTLKQWILENRTRLITLLGLTGIGKTALTVQLIEQIQNEFDYIIYRSLHNTPTLQILQTNLIQFLNGVPAPEERAIAGGLPLLEYLRLSRCLIILDDVQMIFSSGQLAGNYQPGYQNYGAFFKKIAESSHNSCLILLSWEKPREIAALESQNPACRTLKLNGLATAAEEILREKGLAEPEKWPELINLYQGNPSWLNIVAAMIQELFNGNVSELLSYNTLFLGDLESLLQQHFDRLSESEKQVMFWLASQAEPVEISKFPTNLELSPSELLKAVQSLGRRLLIEKVKEGEKTLFTLQPVFMEYVKNQNPQN